MKTPFSITFLLIFIPWVAIGQAFHIDSTKFIDGTKCCSAGADIRYAINTNDNGILFVGSVDRDPGGIYPNFPIDEFYANVLVGKIDDKIQVSWIKVFGGNKDDIAFHACQTPDGGYAVLAYTESANGDVTGFKGTADIWLFTSPAGLLFRDPPVYRQPVRLLQLHNTPTESHT